MRKVSPKRAALNSVAGPWREEYIRTVGECDACGTDQQLSLHELGRARGANRAKCLMEPSCLLVLCCGPGGCHTKWQDRKEVDQLALLWLVRREAYSLRAYLALVSPAAPRRVTSREVRAAAVRLKREATVAERLWRREWTVWGEK